MHTISFIIPTDATTSPEVCSSTILSCVSPGLSFEIIHAIGRQPSKQRNEAAKSARGEWLYFLDDDSELQADTLQSVHELLGMPEVAVIGGPAILAEAQGIAQSAFSALLCSKCGVAHTVARNRIEGPARPVGGEELILCNLLIRKSVFIQSGGFNTALYPNEENELLKRLRRSGHRLYYAPRMRVVRKSRTRVSAFIMQMFRYGVGRGKHILQEFSLRDLVFFIPSLFVLYLLTVVMIPSLALTIPLLLYLAMASVVAGRVGISSRSFERYFAVLATFPLMHISYGVGLLLGVVRGQRPAVEKSSAIQVSLLYDGMAESKVAIGGA